MKEKVVIIGASSGIGYALAQLVLDKGHVLGVAARRLEKLEEIKHLAPGRVFVQQMDVRSPEQVQKGLDNLHKAMGGIDWMVYSSGVGTDDKYLTPQVILPTVQTNVAGFVTAFGHTVQLMKEGHGGLIAGISSVMALRGSAYFPTYSASKAFMSNFMDGARRKVGRWGIRVCDIRPGFIRTPMTADNPRTFMSVSAQRAARDIYRALKKRRNVAYIPGWWAPVAWVIHGLPGVVLKAMKY